MADTGAPLYQSLDENQKRRFTFLARMLRPHWMRFGAMHGGAMRSGPMQDGPMHSGPMQDGHGAWFHHHRDRDGSFGRGDENSRRADRDREDFCRDGFGREDRRRAPDGDGRGMDREPHEL
jgi:hypothetical protein